MPRIERRLAIRIAVLYLFWAGLWILISDKAVAYFIDDPRLLTRVSVLKGWFFILVTSLLLFWLVRQGERARQENLDLLYDIIEGTRDTIFVKDKRGRYILINSSGAAALGLPLASILGRDDFALLPTEVAQRIQQDDHAILETGISRQSEEKLTLWGRSVTLSVFKYPRLDSQGRVRGVIGIARDISDRKQLEDEREQLLETLNERNQELESLNLITANAISTLQLDALLNVLLDRLIAVLKADIGLIFLQQENGLLELAASMGNDQVEVTQNEQAIAYEIAQLIASTGQVLDINDIQRDPPWRTDLRQVPDASHILGIPLRHQQQLVGVLQVHWHASYTPIKQEIRLLEIAAERCALAILNARLFERTQQLQQRLQLQFDRNPLGCITLDLQGCVTDWNPAAEHIFGYTKAEALGRHPCDFIVGDNERPQVREILDRLAQGDMGAHSVNQNTTCDGRTIICEWDNTPLKQRDGDVVGILAMVQDVTERVHNEERLQQYAYYDALTQLPLRRYLVERLEVLLAEPPEQRPLFALFHLNLNRYKTVKYVLGHALAEELLLEVRDRLQSILLTGSTLARIDADEFVILREQLPHPEAAIAYVEQIQQLFSTALQLGSNEVFMEVRVGLVLSTDCEGVAEDYLRAVDMAIHQSQVLDRIPYVRYSPIMQAAAVQRLRMDSEMRSALARREFVLHYQPLVSVGNPASTQRSRQLLGFEALLRWPGPNGWIAPDQIIPLAEETGFIIPLERWVLQQACEDLQQWRSLYPSATSLFVAVNLSSLQLIQPDFVAMVETILRETQLPSHCLKIEITETAVMEQAEKVTAVLEHLRQRNIALSIDDFGTGYSSLSQLYSFPIDTLKIDRSFIQRLILDPRSREVVRTIVVLARELELDLVAKGVETLEQLAELQDMGCDLIQGYLVSHPLPAEDAEALLNRDNWS